MVDHCYVVAGVVKRSTGRQSGSGQANALRDASDQARKNVLGRTVECGFVLFGRLVSRACHTPPLACCQWKLVLVHTGVIRKTKRKQILKAR